MISHGPEKRQLTGLTEVLAPFTTAIASGTTSRMVFESCHPWPITLARPGYASVRSLWGPGTNRSVDGIGQPSGARCSCRLGDAEVHLQSNADGQ